MCRPPGAWQKRDGERHGGACLLLWSAMSYVCLSPNVSSTIAIERESKRRANMRSVIRYPCILVRGKGLIVTIDGPAGSGKSSVAKRLASEIGFSFLDTGAMYRCVTLACLRKKMDLGQLQEVATIASQVQIEFFADKVVLDGEDVSEAIRTPAVTKSICAIADNIAVRESMVAAQRRWTAGRDAVTEGRDQGTIVFPDAECKIFLTATPEERARRRVSQLLELGVDVSYEEVLEMQNQRDLQDTQRESGGLKQATDSIMVWTDGMTEDEVLQSLVAIVESKRPPEMNPMAEQPLQHKPHLTPR